LLAAAGVGAAVAGAGLIYTHFGQPEVAPKAPEPVELVDVQRQEAKVPALARPSPEDLAAQQKKARQEVALAKLHDAVGVASSPNPGPSAIEELRTALAVAVVEAGEGSGVISAAGQRLADIDTMQKARRRYGEALQEVRTAVNDKELLAGRLALQDMADAEKILKSFGEELPMERIKAMMDIAQHKAQLADMERVVEQREALEHGRKQLQEALPAKDTAAARRAMGLIARAEMELRDLHQDFPPDKGLVAEGLVRLHELEKEEQERHRRIDALALLEAAVAARSPQLCVEALAEAEDAGVEPCPTMELAGILARPQELCRQLAASSAPGLSELRSRAQGLSVSDFVEAAKAAAESMEEEDLRAHASELAAALLRNHEIHSVELEKGLETAEVALREKCLERTSEALAAFRQQRDELEAAQRAELAAFYSLKTEQHEREVRATVRAMSNAAASSLNQEGARIISESLVAEREGFEKRVEGMRDPASAVSELATFGLSVQQRSRTSYALASALESARAALAEGRVPAPSSGGLPLLLTSLVPPEQTVAPSGEPLPAEAMLRRAFSQQLSSWEAVALSQPRPGAGLWDHLWASASAPLLQRLHLVGVPMRWLTEGPSVEAAEQNLAALSAAAHLVERGDLRGALAAMEALKGACRAGAAAWMQEVRNALLLQQIMVAAQAQAKSMSAALS